MRNLISTDIMEEDMSKPWPRDYNMPKVDPDKEDETQTYSYKELKKAFEEIGRAHV